MRKIFILMIIVKVLMLYGLGYADDDRSLSCQEIIFTVGGEEITVVEYNDLKHVSADEILRALQYFNILHTASFGISGKKELKLEIFKKIAPTLYERHIEKKMRKKCR